MSPVNGNVAEWSAGECSTPTDDLRTLEDQTLLYRVAVALSLHTTRFSLINEKTVKDK